MCPNPIAEGDIRLMLLLVSPQGLLWQSWLRGIRLWHVSRVLGPGSGAGGLWGDMGGDLLRW